MERLPLSGGPAAFPHRSCAKPHRRFTGARACAEMGSVVALTELSLLAGDATGGDGEAAPVAHLHGLVAMIDARHLQTRDHSENVAAYAGAIGLALGLSAARIVRLRRAAMLHDVGKIGIRSEVLEKPSALTDAEFDEIRLHAAIGGTMLAHAGLHEEAAWVRAHHERVDGRGYPDGLTQREIPLEARILFVADAFEAMTSDRPYRAGVAVDIAVGELRRCAGTQFDPLVVEVLDHLLETDGLTVLALRAR